MSRLGHQIARLAEEDLALRTSPGVTAHAPDDWSDTDDAALLWIRRQGWTGRVESWMLAWVRSARTGR